MSTIPVAGRRVALIGGAGFIGHNLALDLQRRGAHVEIIDGLQVNNLVSLMANQDGVPNSQLYVHLIHERLRLLHEAGITVHVQDARDYVALSQQLNRTQPDVIVQLAAVAHAGRANKNPYNTFDHSMRTLENALDCARGNVEHFVFFSSSMVYGDFPSGAVDEQTPCDPLGIYGALKFGGEKLVIAYSQVFGLPYTIIRPSALYGERCVSRRVSQVFIENALLGRELVLNGNGEERLDFTYIGDLVQGVVRVLEHPEARNQIFNITYGQGRTIHDVVDVIRQEFPDVALRYEPADKLMPERGTLSVQKARDLIGYAPEWPIEQGLLQNIRWYRQLFEERPELFKST